MKCTVCGSTSIRVLDSRDTGDAIRRRRSCVDCEARFTTFERIERPTLWVRKRNNRRELLDRSKLLEGVAHACRKRPLSAEDLEGAVDQVIARLLQRRENEVQSSEVGEAVLAVLLDLDEVAYVRFASVYQAFESVDQFVDAIAPLRRRS